MSYAADLHLHSPYAMAVSPALSLQQLAWWGGAKGVGLLACGDFTHPAWLARLREQLRPASDGLFDLAPEFLPSLPSPAPASSPPRFVLGSEVSCVYSSGGRGRRLHLLVLAPDFAAVDALRAAFAPYGALESDGRPTLRMSGRDVVEAALTASPLCEVIPAHAWTPWYAVYGSRGGFDSLQECFLDMAPHIHAVETGLSSDPAMNWRVPELDNRTLVSFSDAHSAPRVAREVTVFPGEPSYHGLLRALRQGAVEWTAEFYPQEGKYHYDGHRKCGVRFHPAETMERGGVCPVCGGKLTLGVLHRTEALSARPPTRPEQSPDGLLRDPDGERPPFRRLLPLEEIIAEAQGRRPAARSVRDAYLRLVERVGPEIHLLTAADAAEIASAGGDAGERIAEGVLRARRGDVGVLPGFDGVYGAVSVW